MFNKVQRELKTLERGVRIPITLPLDDEGYLDRICPAVSCQAEFKVLFQDWREKVRDEQVYCPTCRYEASASEWNTAEQREHIKSRAIAHVQNIIHRALSDDARAFNRRQQPGFIQLSMSAKRGSPPIIMPIDAAKAMRQRFICEVCSCHYASIGAAFFCPACGYNSVIATFNQTIETVRNIVSMTASVRTVLATTFDEDIARDSMRYMIEDNLGRLVGAFQIYAETLFERLPKAAPIKRRKNVFQNLIESSSLWRTAVGKGYEDMLSAGELSELAMLFQKRHLIAHRNGVVDQDYIDKSGDKTYAVGQRMVIHETTVLRLAELLSQLAEELKKIT